MSKLKLSPWHDGNIAPEHVGVYQVESSANGDYYSMWDGAQFLGAWWSVERAITRGTIYHADKYRQWRGVLK
jgi:hypothetical protein